MEYNFFGLNLKKEEMFEGDIEQMQSFQEKKEYYLTLSVVLEDQPVKIIPQELQEIKKDLLQSIEISEEKGEENGFHIYKNQELHFSLINFFTYNYASSEETDESAFEKFQIVMKNSEVLQELIERIESLIKAHKLNPDLYKAKLGILHAGDGSIALQAFLDKTLIEFCDSLAEAATFLGFTRTKTKIYPAGSINKCRSCINLIRILKDGKELIKEKDNLGEVKDTICKWNNKYFQSFSENLLGLPIKKIRLNLSGSYFSSKRENYKLIKSYSL